ncbi:BamA/TamA family outer membrane protein [Spirosoma telluris]|uniref:BamA/TamA family outer membrane protein n=1 Tax=Spirosoma telluris TaxID=2183553 RepID=UPI002FC38D22
MNKPTYGLLTYLVRYRSLLVGTVCALTFPLVTWAQADSSRLAMHTQAPLARTDTSADVWDVYYRFINRKGHRTTEGQKPGFHPSVFPELAYALQTGFAVGLNANLSFTSADPKQNVSVIYFTPQYTQYQQVIVPVEVNLWTKGNRYNIVTDWRYYDYSADNFGLGDNSRADVDDQLKYSYLRLYQSVLRQVAPNFSVGIGYSLDYHWKIREENNTPQLNNDFQQYESTTRTISSGPTFSFQYTNRRNPNNPQNGFFGSLVFRPNLRALGSDHNWQSVLADFRKYVPLSSDGRHILTFWNVNWLSFGGQAPYLDLPSTGWDTHSNLGRGYAQDGLGAET